MKLNKDIQSDFESLIDRKKKYLLAFSGGPDSVYLLWMLSLYFGKNLPDHILLCYINYHDSPFVDEEESLVDRYIKDFQLSYIKNDVFYDEKKDKNFEEWARDYRYDLFLSIVKEKNLEAVLTAHQKTDVVETYLLQKQRGNLPLYYGLRKDNVLYGLRIIRPLLSITKEALTMELDREKIPYYFDITNTNPKKQRNSIRMKLKEEEIQSISMDIRKDNERIERLYHEFENYLDGMSFSIYDALDEEAEKRYCFFLLDHIQVLVKREGYGKLLHDFLKRKENGQLRIEDIICYRTKDRFFFSENLDAVSYSYTYDKEGYYENRYFSIDLDDPSMFNLKGLPVTIRNYHDGDRISTNLPTKDVRKALQKQSVPFYLIHSYPVFVQDDRIVCVPFFKDIKDKKIPLKLKLFRE